MVTHKASVGFIGRTQKTAKAKCGRTVKASTIAVGAECTCPECRATIDAFWRGTQEIVASMKASGRDTHDTEATLARPATERYQSVYFDTLLCEALRSKQS